ncbi:MAG TPA: c-type cytochrome [Burkholderiaceae bacterium]|nr:c-type cytochrome [Burkholderiaceae bacterium]
MKSPVSPVESLPRSSPATRALLTAVAMGAAAAIAAACGGSSDNSEAEHAAQVEQGKQIFRYDTFGDEGQWTDTLRMHEVISAAVDPVTALSVGLKVDAEALPAAVVDGIRNGTVDLMSPATTVTLLKLNAVVGLKGTVETVNGVDRLTRVGITCALCHSTVDNSFAPGIGKRLDGWPNRDLNPGAIIALSPAVDAATKAALNAWGKGKFDPRHNVDGISKPLVIPPAYGLDRIQRITVTGDGENIAYWNRYVAVVEMGGQGSFSEPRLNLNITHGTEDLVSSKLPALQAYQLTLKAPPPPAGSFDAAAAARGKVVFEGAGNCASCHSGASFTDANLRLHPPSDSAAEPETPSYASRSATKQYRTSPLKGVWQHAPYFHDGSAATLEDVVQNYNTKQSLGLTPAQVNDVAQYLKSL